MVKWRTLPSIREWPLTAFIVVAVVLGNVMAITYYISYSQIKESDRWVDYTQDNIAGVLEFSMALQEAMVAQHSYLSLGRQDYRAMAVTKLANVPAALKPLLKRIQYPDSQNALAEMQFETDALVKMGEQFIRARERGDLAGAFDPKMSDSFFTLARHIQHNANVVRRTEKRLLDHRLKEAANSQTYYISMMLAASLFSLVIVVVISWLMLKLRSRQEVVEDELREARERLNLAIQGTNDGVWDWNPTTNEIYYSPRLKEIYGYKQHELANTVEAIRSNIYPDDLIQVEHELNRYLTREIPRYEVVYRIRHRDGSTRWIMSRGAALWNSRGVAIRMVGVHTDVTSLKQMEDELREAKVRADSANRAKTNFLANMSHEIRTPMNAIIGITGILAKKTPPESREREYIDALSIASKSLFSLINDLLDISKLDDGSLLLEHVPFDPRLVCEETATLIRVRAEEKKIALHVELSPTLPPQLIGDSHRLRQIVSNLLSNAVKFTDEGSVTLRAGMTPVGHLEIRVRDTGIGIPPSARKTIFEKFTQSDASITRRFGGTGLGLSICRELSELMGGEIDLISEEGKGSEFIVTLPLPTASAPVAEPISIMPHPDEVQTHTRGHVLLVEDYKPNVLVARTVLSSLGYRCDVATTGGEALAKLCADTHGEYVAVLMDVQLPDLSGVDATSAVRAYEAEHALHRLPIIAMTAHALMGDREKFMEAGMDAYIAKPFDPDDLAEKLTELALKPAQETNPTKTPRRKKTAS